MTAVRNRKELGRWARHAMATIVLGGLLLVLVQAVSAAGPGEGPGRTEPPAQRMHEEMVRHHPDMARMNEEMVTGG
jgi:hypothetical protein